jgi:hypothetical protein
MKKLILAAGLIAVGATTASAQGIWRKEEYPYAQRHHAMCQDKARRLHAFENRSARDGVVTPRERRTIEALRHDLDRTCGRFRWRG